MASLMPRQEQQRAQQAAKAKADAKPM